MAIVDPLIKRFEDEDFDDTETEEDGEFSTGQHEPFSSMIKDIRITKLTPRIQPKGVHFNISKNNMQSLHFGAEIQGNGEPKTFSASTKAGYSSCDKKLKQYMSNQGQTKNT